MSDMASGNADFIYGPLESACTKGTFSCNRGEFEDLLGPPRRPA